MYAKMKYAVLVLTSLTMLGCQIRSSEQNARDTPLPISRSDATSATSDDRKSSVTEREIDSLWKLLVFEKPSCLTGKQYVRKGQFGGKGCAMTSDMEWKAFFAMEKQQITKFLLSKLSDTITTKVHTCPFSDAQTGELAVYSLQNIYKKNWFDFEPFQSYQNKPSESITQNHQAWLQQILQDENKRAILKENWQALASKSNTDAE